ncbi:MAG: hypothetical protein KGS72_08420 [Cyanobacteria bacterium REEB67]|nr:hypothetical protein [Cyanobacteria bacterium REEB67]
MKKRRPPGNMLVLVCLTIGVIIAVIMLGLTFNSFLFGRSHAQFDADGMAMSLAAAINAGDRVGQMNELLESSRELVYESRANADDCSGQGLRAFKGLYSQLADEARQGQAMLEQERRNQIQVICQEIRSNVLKANASGSASRPFGLPWLITSDPRIEQVDLGSIKNVASSVSSLDGLDDLARSDLDNHFVNPLSKLFDGNIDARLPTVDRDLDFKFCSLPACVQGTAAPARNVSAQAFLGSACIIAGGAPTHTLPDFVPSAVLVTYTLDTQFGRDSKNQTALSLLSAATAHGATVGSGGELVDDDPSSQR